MLLPGLLIFAVVLSATFAMWEWPYQEWTRTSSQFVWQLALVGPIAAAAATFYAGRVTAPSRIFALRSARRPPWHVLARHLSLLAGSHLAGYLLALAPLVVVTVTKSQYGRADFLVIATGLVALLCATVAGYLIGVWGRSAVLAPLSFVLLLGVSVAGTSGLTPLSPVPEKVLVLGQESSEPLLVFRLVLLVSLILLFVQLTITLLRSVSRVPPLQALTALPFIVLLVVVAVLRPAPEVSSYQRNPPRECVARSGTEYCVHAGHRGQLPAFVAAAEPVIQAYGSRPERARRVYDRALFGNLVPGHDMVIWPSLEPYNSVGAGVADVVASSLAGTNTCVIRHGFTPPQDVIDFNGYFFTWLRNGGRPPSGDYNPFQNVPAPTVQRWIEAHETEIASCTIDLRGLPR